MKAIFIFLSVLLGTSNVMAQWTRTNVSTTANISINDLCEHNGNLYAAVFDNGLLKLNETSNTWEIVQTSLPPSSNAAYITRLASSGNYLYAFVNDQTCASTTIYKSTDNGATFVTDTSGHPRYGSFPAQCEGYPADVANVYVLNGKLITVVNGGFLSKNPEDPTWVKETDANVKSAELFGENNKTWYAWSDNNKLHNSTDNGQTWTTPTNTGLPALFLAKVMNVNPTSGRIYIAGSSNSTGEYRMMYSDNEGTSWDSLPIHQILEKDWIGQQQKVNGMISNGDDLTLMLVNDANNSHPDVIKSTDGGQTFTIDTVGLQPNAFGTVLVKKMLYFKGKLYFAPNYFDIYTQGEGTATGIKDNLKIQVSLYPNPTNGLFTVDLNHNETLQLLDNNGKVLLVQTNNTIDISNHPNAMYFVQIISNNNIQTLKLIKQ